MNLGQSLLRVRREIGMKQMDAAKKAKITATYLSQLEKGHKTEPASGVLKRLAKVYDVPPMVFAWYAMEPSDVKAGKKEAYEKLKPAIDGLISELIPIASKSFKTKK